MKRSLGQFGSMTIDVNVGYLLAFAGLDPNPIYVPAATRARVRTTQNSSYITPSLCSGFGISLGHRLHFRRARGPHALAGGEQCKVVPVLEFDLNGDLAHASRIARPDRCDKQTTLPMLSPVAAGPSGEDLDGLLGVVSRRITVHASRAEVDLGPDVLLPNECLARDAVTSDLNVPAFPGQQDA